MKHIKHWLITVAVLLGCLTVSAQKFEVDGIYYNIPRVYRDEVCVEASPNGYSGDVTIPSSVTYNGKKYQVTEISYAFNDCSELTSVEIPTSVNWISGFQNCSKLTSINLSSVRTIADHTFLGCTSLKDVQLADDYGNAVLGEIGIGAFSGCINLKYIQLPYSLYAIGDEAFYNTGIEIIVIPENVASIGRLAFGDHSPLVVFRHLTAPEQMAGCGGIGLIPESANGYDSDEDGMEFYSYYSARECFIREDKLYIWGATYHTEIRSDMDEYGGDLRTIENVVFTPDANLMWQTILPQLPNVKKVSVLEGHVYTTFNNALYTVEGSNAVFAKNNELVSGCAATVIPEGATSIENFAFAGCATLKSIEIPSSVIYIGVEAFTGCSSLGSIGIPASVTTIGSDAFANCSGLQNIVVDAENPIYDSREDCNAIIETQSNKLIIASHTTTIPSSVTSIGEQAFFCCANMDVTIPSSVTSFGNKSFGGTKNLYFESSTPPTIEGDIFGWGAIFVPSDAYDSYCNADVWSKYKDRIVTHEMAQSEVEVWSTEGMSGVLNEVGLNEADKVVKLKVKGEINSYDMIVMRDKMPLLQEIDLSEANVVASSKPFYQTYCTGMNSLGSHAFYDLDKLVSVKLPKGLTTLGDYAFYGCERLKSVDASTAEGLYVGRGTFESCSDLQEFVAPSVISELGIEAFKGCRKLRELAIHRMTGSIERNVFGGSGIKRLNIDSIGGHIASEAFSGCTSLKEVKVGTLVGDLGEKAFHGCSNLTSVEFARGPQKIGSKLFALADNLENFVVGEGASEISNNVFHAYKVVYTRDPWGGIQVEEVDIDRQALKRVVLPESLQKIGSEAFYRCTSLSEFTIPQGVTSIGASAFNGCSALRSIEVPNGVTVLADNTFGGCSSLENITLPNGLTKLGSATFRGCASLTDITLPSSLTTIEPSAFSGCGALKNVTFPDGLAMIGEEAFSGCGFKTLRLPPMLRMIDENAFSSCTALEELHIPSSVEHIGGGAFSKCQRLNAVYTYTVEPTEIAETTFSTFASATLYVPSTSFWNYYWNIGWSRFNHKNFQEFNQPYDYFYLNNDYYLNGGTGYIEGTPDADLHPGSGLIVEADQDNEGSKQNLGEVNVSTDADGNSAAIIGDDNLFIENLKVNINVKGGRWYFFAFPWDVSLDRISMQNGSDYVFRYYDGDERAKNGKGGWKDINENHLKAARGYIFQCSDDDILVIGIDDVKFRKEDKYNELVTHSSQNLNDASWNLMGNPYLSYYDLAAMDYTAPVTVWDGAKYVAIRPGDDDYQFAPYEAFFVQKPENEENIAFSADAQMTKTQSVTLAAQQAATRRTRSIDPQRQLINLVLSYGETSDRTRVVFNNRQSHNYEVACDAAKFQSEDVAQIYTLDGEGVRYAINERPVGNGVVKIGYTAVENNYYTIEAVRMDAKVYLYDAETKIMHNLDEGSYTFFSGKGTFEKRFTLGMQDGETTGVGNIDIDAAVEVVEGGILLNTNATATVYNAAGMIVVVQQGVGLVQLPAGTYVVCIGGNKSKVVVK